MIFLDFLGKQFYNKKNSSDKNCSGCSCEIDLEKLPLHVVTELYRKCTYF